MAADKAKMEADKKAQLEATKGKPSEPEVKVP